MVKEWFCIDDGVEITTDKIPRFKWFIKAIGQKIERDFCTYNCRKESCDHVNGFILKNELEAATFCLNEEMARRKGLVCNYRIC